MESRKKEKWFSFHFESSFRSRDNQIFTFQKLKYHEIIRYPSIKHGTRFTEQLGKQTQSLILKFNVVLVYGQRSESQVLTHT